MVLSGLTGMGLNNNLLSKNIANNIIGKLSLFLRKWPIKKN